MSFANPLHLSGKQLENFNNTQKVLQNITNSQQQQQSINNQFGSGAPAVNNKIPLQKQVSFNVENNSKLSSIPQSQDVSFLSSNQQKQSEPHFQNFQSGNQQNFQKNNKNDSIADLVQQSDLALKQLEDQFQSLNLGTQMISRNKQNIGNDTFNNKGRVLVAPPQIGGGSNIQSLISDVDKIIQQAQQQTKQLTSNDDGAFRIQSSSNYNSNYQSDKGRGFPNAARGLSSSPSKRKHSNSRKNNKSKNKHKKSKKNRRKDSYSDDTSSYSGESDSIIQEQEDESRFDDSSNDENYDDDEEIDYKRRQRIKNKNKFTSNSNTKKNNNKQDRQDVKSISNVSRARSNQSRNNQQNPNNNNNGTNFLQKSQLKSLPGMCGGTKNEPSVYSSASRMKLQQSQVSHQNQLGGFRRCPDESEDDITNHKNVRNSDDSFDINEDFNINSATKINSNKKNRNNNGKLDKNMFKKQLNNDNYETNGRRSHGRDYQENQEDIYLMNRYNSQKELSVNSKLQRGIQNQKEIQQQMQLQADEDNLVFCINCEEYIKVEKVDDHSNICEPAKDDHRHQSMNQVIQKINEKLIKIRFLIKTKNSHIINQPVTNNEQQVLVGLYEQIIEILSVCIENNQDTSLLDDAQSDINRINIQLMRNNHSSSHYLLYLTQKVNEFIQRKHEFITTYSQNRYNTYNHNQDDHDDEDDFIQQDNNHFQNQQFNSNNRQQQQRELNNFQNNLDAISIASSTFNRQNSNQQYQKIQQNNSKKDPIKIFSKIEENLQILNQNQQQIQPKNQGLPPRQPNNNNNNINNNNINNQRNNIFSQDQSPLKALQQHQQTYNNRDIFQSPATATNYSPQNLQQSPNPQFYQQQQQQTQNYRDQANLNQPAQRVIRNQNNQVQPFTIFGKDNQQQQYQASRGISISSPQTFQKEDQNTIQQVKRNIFADQQATQKNQVPIAVRQLTNQSEKSLDTYEYSYKGSQQKQFNGNGNQMIPVQTVTVRESQITKMQNNLNQYNQNNAHMNSNNKQEFQNQDTGSPYKLQSPYKVENNEENQIGVKKQKFFLLANSIKQRYPQSQLYLIADLWKEAYALQIQDRDWERFIITKFQH